jgi:5-methylcytosine-specific restriction protein A
MTAGTGSGIRSFFFAVFMEEMEMSPRKPLLPCRHPGCPNLSEERYCPAHRTAPVRDKEADRYYNQHRRDKNSQNFYDSKAWRALRKRQLNKQPLCEICLAEGRFNRATLVHHKVGIRDGGDGLSADNLQSLCWSCHSRLEKSKHGDG